ncbi:PCI domain-containing protein 2-like [Convolutriloba macropyga]|uniref:PCI domain-containing protein 2-like n=1 Tax=Convolutriloba macropyga TaxID=536237 RepID=UPI003F522412
MNPYISAFQYLAQLRQCLSFETGDTCATLFSFRDRHIMNPKLRMDTPEAKVTQFKPPLASPYDEMIISHLKAIYFIHRENFAECWANHLACLQAFSKDFQNNQKEDNWSLPLMVELIIDARHLSLRAARQMHKSNEAKTDEILMQCADAIMACFRICASDTRTDIERSKRWGMLHVVNQLFKIYFKMNNVKLCKPLIRAIEGCNIKEEYTKAQLVAYKYFVGRLEMFENDYRAAEQSLLYAFHNCYPGSRRNLRLILIYLIPVKMLLAKLPSHGLIHKFALFQFQDIAKSLRNGDVRLYNRAMARCENFFIKTGILLILERLKNIVYRNLFRRIARIVNSHQIDIKAFMEILHYMGETHLDINEVEFIIANLIYLGYVKGYISHQHMKVVISKQNPFPPISSVI